jgi:hypothetical protein
MLRVKPVRSGEVEIYRRSRRTGAGDKKHLLNYLQGVIVAREISDDLVVRIQVQKATREQSVTA